MLFLNHLLGHRLDVYLASFLYELRHANEFFGKFFREFNANFYPIDIFGKSQSLNVLDIVRMVVNQRHGTHAVVSFHQHTFRVKIGESKRAHNVFHASFAAKFFYFGYQSGGHLFIIDKVKPTEADFFVIPLLVGQIVYNGSYASDTFSVTIGKVHFRLAEIVGRIAFGAQSILDIKFKGGNVIGIIFVEFFWKTNEIFPLFIG